MNDPTHHASANDGLASCFWTEPSLFDDASQPSCKTAPVSKQAFLWNLDWQQIPTSSLPRLERFFLQNEVAVCHGGGIAWTRREPIQTDADPPPRVLNLFSERFGITATDLLGNDIINVQFRRHRRDDGSFGYDADQTQLGEVDDPIALPAEVRTVDDVANWIGGWRSALPNNIRFFATLDAWHAQEHFAIVTKSGFDGLVIVADQPALAGLPIATLVRRLRRDIDASSQAPMPLWVVPPVMSIDDLGKLVVLGADGIAVDQWVAGDVRNLLQSTSPDAHQFVRALHRWRGRCRLAEKDRGTQPALASTDAAIAKILGLPSFGATECD